MRERGIRDLAVLRAIEAVPRAGFVAERYADLALKPIDLPAERGQSVPEPFFVARMLVGARLAAHHRVAVVGVGAGYLTAVLSGLVASVVGFERLPSLVTAARSRFDRMGLSNIALICADGLAADHDGLYDRILLVGSVDPLPPRLWASVAPAGTILYARRDATGPRPGDQVLVRGERQTDGILRQVVLGPARLAPLRPGVVAASGVQP
ncbi:protein-L-isoaspartate(D-aspartate) O-methyltransferase [Lichenihabitans sp. Uapishka_5]|uniref:protein-L-isoaspartate O-methyltransferase family protein n=1 Tax=Lichenihabitans sp. Uapishka_5 TaxID=3037302 RepID=UPI0029E7D0C8|nr:protein-L-isoaspartate(D-aspartate) O-methyltransferase [Lichenihabitans sp. Uapishka_5]MDX7950367.1 protein-L-isoaspartate(D-aspartate) O-methyltransferase [Lichenihabitans sp. Uapishka_5]